MKKSYTLDSFAVIAYLKKEKAGRKIRELLDQAIEGKVVLYLHEINLGEIQYIIHREKGEAESEKIITWLRACPISFVTLEQDNLTRAAKLKATYPISYADAFAVSTAITKNAVLLTGDPEFKKIEKEVEVEWL